MGTTTQQGLARLDSLAAERGITLERDVPLAPMTTLRVGGPADRFASPATVDELVDLLRLASDARAPAFLLGKGSDLVVADTGMRGLVIRVRADAIGVEGTTVRAEAGASMAAAARRLGRPDAARALADELLAMAERRDLPSESSRAAAP